MTQNNMELFCKALIEARNRITDDILMEFPDDIVPSLKHKKKMQQIIKNGGIYYPIRKKFLIALIAALLALLVGCTIYIKRNEIANFYEEIYEKYAVVFSPSETGEKVPTVIEEEYTLNYIPEGYQFYSENKTSASVSMIWKNANNDVIFFVQNNVNSVNYFDLEKSNSEIRVINDIQIYYRKSDNSYIYLWSDVKYTYKITLTETFDEDVIVKIIEGVKPSSN